VTVHSPHEFLASCGATRPLRLLVAHGDQSGEQHCFHVPFVLVGREDSNDLVLNDEQVSKRHAYLQMIDGQLYCLDLDSRTGMRWQGNARRNGWLTMGEEMAIGPFQIALPRSPRSTQEADNQRGDPLEERTVDSVALPPVTIELCSHRTPYSCWQMSRVLALVGRQANCKVRLPGAEISRFHCALLRTPGGLWVIDLLSRTGTYLGQERIRWMHLDHGDPLRLGSFILRVWYDQSATPEHALLYRPDSATKRVLLSSTSRELQARGQLMQLPSSGPEPSERHSSLLSPGGNPLPPSSFPDLGNALPDGSLPGNSSEQTQQTITLLVPVFQQLGLIQQQMTDQFQQTILVVARMLGAMHKEQVGLIQSELKHLQQITAELQTLKAQLGTSALPAPLGIADSGLGIADSQTTTNEGGLSPASGSCNPQSAIHNPESDETQPPPQPPPPSPSQEKPANERVHVWLTQRIAALEKERESIWQKIVGFLTGK
jgi:pSer/pThr/pTyr-binding forkhead associated (FHA) protein